MKRFRPLATLFAVALLIVGVLGVYRLGWREGYGTAWMQAQPREDEGATPYAAPFAPWGWPMYRVRQPLMVGGHLGRLLSLGLVLLLGVAAVKALTFKAWMHKGRHMHPAGPGGPPHAPWHHTHWGHGPHGRWGHGPWCDCGQEKPGHSDTPPADEQVAKVRGEPDAA